METPPENQPAPAVVTPPTPFFERFTNFVETFRKVVVDILVFLIVIIFFITLINHYSKKQLIIYPFKACTAITNQGYTGEILTSMVLDRIHQIKNAGSIYYRQNQLEMPSWDNGIDEYKDAVNNDIFTQASTLVKFFYSNNIKTAAGDIVAYGKHGIALHMRVGDDMIQLIADSTSGLDNLIDKAAQFVLEKTDPYNLASYYLSQQDPVNCLRITQKLLNDKKLHTLALQLRGSAYIKVDSCADNVIAIKFLDSALKNSKEKDKWLVYWNLGRAYFFQNDTAHAIKSFVESIKRNPENHSAYRYYGDLLRIEFENAGYDKKPIKKLDDAIDKYKTAIDYSPSEFNEYVSLISALYDKKAYYERQYYAGLHNHPVPQEVKTGKAQSEILAVNIGDTFRTLTEIYPDTCMTYFKLGQIQEAHYQCADALASYQKAKALCKDTLVQRQIGFYIDKISPAPGSATVNKKGKKVHA